MTKYICGASYAYDIQDEAYEESWFEKGERNVRVDDVTHLSFRLSRNTENGGESCILNI